MPLQLKVWYGILTACPGETASAERPALPDWAAGMLTGKDATDEDMTAEMASRGYDGDPLTWIELHSETFCGYGLAIARSVQTAPDRIGEVNTTYPDEVADQWLTSIARASNALGLTTALITWYQTACYT